MPLFTRSVVEAFGESHFNLVLVFNKALSSAERSALLPKCHLLVERKNIGRDFGAYKDAIALIENCYAKVERLFLMNDSVYFFCDGLGKVIGALDGPEDFIGVSEVFEHHYHVASFMLSLGPGVLQHDVFRRFWRNYRPISTRQWCIHQGEGKFSADLIAAGFVPRILFRTRDLCGALAAVTQAEQRLAVALLPIKMRDKIAEGKGDLAEQIAAAVASRNQMHAGGLLFHKYLGMPLMKRDLLFRSLYRPAEIAAAIADFPMRDVVINDLIRRGSGENLGLIKRVLHLYDAL
jgi:hypothetical protein